MKQNLGIFFRALGVSLILVLLPLAASGFGPKVPLIELNASGSAAEMGRGTSLAADGGCRQDDDAKSVQLYICCW